jgi:hypothetical protein
MDGMNSAIVVEAANPTKAAMRPARNKPASSTFLFQNR